MSNGEEWVQARGLKVRISSASRIRPIRVLGVVVCIMGSGHLLLETRFFNDAGFLLLLRRVTTVTRPAAITSPATPSHRARELPLDPSFGTWTVYEVVGSLTILAEFT